MTHASVQIQADFENFCDRQDVVQCVLARELASTLLTEIVCARVCGLSTTVLHKVIFYLAASISEAERAQREGEHGLPSKEFDKAVDAARLRPVI